ncbi:hypothetical protein QA600_16485 [Natronococcus sp. A-GB1]|uniref:hypothetical protein n=1 Tax=Natronococcus sp. A-GB1 TaxID=3037648 RepID=UPI00241C88F8|nr:hypothetical protein [Natronococcus sp. A-GB1]MDG5760931.1 hypothetical protein [Natronococcus sp. A-GB1]
MKPTTHSNHDRNTIQRVVELTCERIFSENTERQTPNVETLREKLAAKKSASNTDSTESFPEKVEGQRYSNADQLTSSVDTLVDSLHAYDTYAGSITVAIDITRLDPDYWLEATTAPGDASEVEVTPTPTPRFATITTVNTPVPVVLAVEPLSKPGDETQSEPRTYAEIVRTLIEQAKEHVEIDTLLASRAFHAGNVIAEFERQNVAYIIFSRLTTRDRERISTIKTRDDATHAVEHDVDVFVDGTPTCTTNLVYVPEDSASDGYVGFVTNIDVSKSDLESDTVPETYKKRWIANVHNRLLRTRLHTKGVSQLELTRADYERVATEVNAYSLTNHLLRESTGHTSEQFPLPFDQFLHLLHQKRWGVTSGTSPTGNHESR